jgi:hypothetical protein
MLVILFLGDVHAYRFSTCLLDSWAVANADLLTGCSQWLLVAWLQTWVIKASPLFVAGWAVCGSHCVAVCLPLAITTQSLVAVVRAWQHLTRAGSGPDPDGTDLA